MSSHIYVYGICIMSICARVDENKAITRTNGCVKKMKMERRDACGEKRIRCRTKRSIIERDRRETK